MKKTGLSFVDRWLTLWIFLAMAAGVLLGKWPEAVGAITSLRSGTTSIPIALGLILMMYPPLAKVRYEELRRTVENRRLILLSTFVNWIAAPIFMFILAVVFLSGHPEYAAGVVLVGLARCIAMVIVWNDLSGGNRELGVFLVAINAIFQIAFYAVYMFLFLNLGFELAGIGRREFTSISIADSAVTVLIYLGIPFALGFLSRLVLIRMKGREWFESVYAPFISPITLIALLFTIVVMFATQGERILTRPWDVLAVALPYTIYFVAVWFAVFFIARRLSSHRDAVTTAFSAASNDFELAIAVAIAVFGIESGQAFAAVIGPLIEVPVMVLLVKAAASLKPGEEK